MMKIDIQEQLSYYNPFDKDEAVSLSKILNFFTICEDFFSRKNERGHITASAWILSKDRTHTLLCHHKKLNKWLQLGGHVEECDNTVGEAALRESIEESGIQSVKSLQTAIFDIDVHLIPIKNDEPEHLHYDIRYLFTVDTDDYIVSNEANGLMWVDIRQIFTMQSEHSILRMAKKSLNILVNQPTHR